MLFFVAGPTAELPPTPAKAALVTIVIGERYERTWNRICRHTWVDYADRCGFDVIAITATLDSHDTRSPAWQKLLILNQPWSQRYERLVWMDSDIVVADDAPNILQYSGPPEKVSLCLDGGRLSSAEMQVYVERSLNIRTDPGAYATTGTLAWQFMYENNHLPAHKLAYNTGVMALSPQHHNDLLLHAYQQPQVTYLYEQPYLSHALVERDLGFAINPRFNWGLIESLRLYLYHGLKNERDENFVGRMTLLLTQAELRNAYFLHFYAAMHILEQFAGGPEVAAAA